MEQFVVILKNNDGTVRVNCGGSMKEHVVQHGELLPRGETRTGVDSSWEKVRWCRKCGRWLYGGGAGCSRCALPWVAVAEAPAAAVPQSAPKLGPNARFVDEGDVGPDARVMIVDAQGQEIMRMAYKDYQLFAG